MSYASEGGRIPGDYRPDGGSDKASATPNATPAPPAMVGQYPTSLIQALMQPQYLTNLGFTDPALAQYSASNANTSIPPAIMAMLTPNATLAQINKSMVPQDQQAQSALNQQLANFGIGGGSAVKATEQLQGQLAGSIAPALAQAIQAAQANVLGGTEFGMGENLQQSMGNSANALQAALANQSSANQSNMYNAKTLNEANAANVGGANSFQEMLLKMIMGNYETTMGANASVVGSGQGASNQQAVNYGGTITQTPDPWSQIFGAAAAAAPYFAG